MSSTKQIGINEFLEQADSLLEDIELLGVPWYGRYAPMEGALHPSPRAACQSREDNDPEWDVAFRRQYAAIANRLMTLTSWAASTSTVLEKAVGNRVVELCSARLEALSRGYYDRLKQYLTTYL